MKGIVKMDDEKTEVEETTTEEKTDEKTEQKTEPQTVPKERLDEVNAEMASLKESNAVLQQNIALLQANAPKQPAAETFDIYKHVGLDPDDPDDVPNQKQLREINKYFQGQRDAQMEQIRFLSDHPDYAELVGTAEQVQSGQFAEPIKAAIKADPSLMAMIQTSANPMLAAYKIAKIHQKNTAAGKKTTKTEAKAAIDEAVENANRVKTSANTKGGEALTEEGRFESMGDEEFMKLAASHGAQL
jgi:hypothetical protein